MPENRSGIPDPQSMADAMYVLNAKAVTDAGVALLLGAAQDVKTNQAQMNLLGTTVVGRLAATLAQPDPVEAAASKQIMTGHAGLDTGLVSALTAIMAKVMQTTPPVTGYGPVTGPSQMTPSAPA